MEKVKGNMKVKGRNICYANHWRRKNNKIVGDGGWVYGCEKKKMVSDHSVDR